MQKKGMEIFTLKGVSTLLAITRMIELCLKRCLLSFLRNNHDSICILEKDCMYALIMKKEYYHVKQQSND